MSYTTLEVDLWLLHTGEHVHTCEFEYTCNKRIQPRWLDLGKTVKVEEGLRKISYRSKKHSWNRPMKPVPQKFGQRPLLQCLVVLCEAGGTDWPSEAMGEDEQTQWTWVTVGRVSRQKDLRRRRSPRAAWVSEIQFTCLKGFEDVNLLFFFKLERGF